MGRNHRRAEDDCKTKTPRTPVLNSGRMKKVNLEEKFAAFTEHWRPKIIGELNGQEAKVVKFQGVFPWHHHETEDELFLVWRGRMRVEFRDQTIELNRGEFLI